MAARWGGVVLAAMAAAVAAGCHGEKATEQSAGALRATPSALDFGATALGGSNRLELRLSNGGRAPFAVTGVSSTSPNVEVEPVQPFTLAGGDARSIVLRFVPSGEGKVRGAIRVRTDQDPDHPESELPVEGLGVRALAGVQERALDFGAIPIGADRELTLTFSNLSQVPAPVQLGLAGPDVDEFRSPLGPEGLTLAPGESRQVPVAFRAARLGVAQAQATVQLCAQCEQTVIPLGALGISAAIDLAPLTLDFGTVAVGAVAEQTAQLKNLGNVPVVFDGVRILGDAEGVLSAAPVGQGPGTLAPGQSVTVAVRYAPTRSLVLDGALLEVSAYAQGESPTSLKLPILGAGGSGCVTVSPRRLDFGVVPEGSRARAEVSIFNRCTAAVSVGAPALSVQQGGYFSLDAPGGFSVEAGATRTLGVVFAPKTGAGKGLGTLALDLQGPTGAVHQAVALSGEGRAFAPCTFAVEPASLDFGTTEVGSSTTLGVAIHNTGATDCFVSGMALAAGSDPAFTAGPGGSQLLPAGGRAVLPVTFAPKAPGSSGALVEAWVNHPTQGHVTAPVAGVGAQRCLSVSPATLDFGTRALSCGEKAGKVTVVNACAHDVSLSALSVDPGQGFLLASAPALPAVLPAHHELELQIRSAPQATGTQIGALRVEAGSDGPLTAGLVAAVEDSSTRTDVFVQEVKPKVDVLFVIDNSGSMSEEQEALSKNLSAFLSAARADGVDYHLGVTTTGIAPSPGQWSICPGGAQGGEAGRLFPADGSSPRLLTPQTEGQDEVFAKMVKVGTCAWLEQGLEAAARALSAPLSTEVDDPRTALVNDGNLGFLRPEAKLALVFISDEDDQSDGELAAYGALFQGLKGGLPGNVIINAIVGPQNLSQSCPTASGTGTRYMALAEQTGGVVENICTPDWTRSLESLSAATFQPRRSFQLSQTPADPAEISVTLDGNEVTTGWSYDAPTSSVVFEPASAPTAGAVIAVTYPLGC